MVDHAMLRQALTRFVRLLSGRYRIGRVLYELTDSAVDVLACDGAGVAVRNGEALQFVTATDQWITRLEKQQVRGCEGPCHDAFRSGEEIASADLKEEQRWSGYRPLALERGARAVAGIPLVARGQTIGALNLYWIQPHACSAEELEAARLLADMGAAYIANQVLLEDAQRLNGQLQLALESRMVIEQAKGIVAERHRLDPDGAFDRLRTHARSNRCKLHEVAERVVDGDLDV